MFCMTYRHIAGENNQFLNDDGSSQKLTKDTIMNLKAQGFEGEVSYHFYVCRADEELNMFPICQA